MENVENLFLLKKCPVCKESKNAETDYWKGQFMCIPCQKHKQKTYWNSRTPKRRLEQHLKYKYDLTIKELTQTLDIQGGCCAICADLLPDLLVYNNRRRGYAIDHNHETGQFRGILCLPCNSMLGMAKDSAKLLQKAAAYLDDRGSYHQHLAAHKK